MAVWGRRNHWTASGEVIAMLVRKLRAILLVPLAVLLLGAAPLLVDPTPIAVPPGLSAQAVAQAVRVGVSQRGWIVTRQDPGYIEATLNLRSHMAKVGISYDELTVTIKYLDSSNLDYQVKKDGPHIHRNYLKWINNIVGDINVQLQLAEAQLRK
jgi:hypothetical protein